jgi:hypothetical protein
VLGESAVRRSTELLSTKIKYPAQIERIVNNEIMSMLDGSVIHSKAEMRTCLAQIDCTYMITTGA